MIIKRVYLLFSLLLILYAVSAFALEEELEQTTCPPFPDLVECESPEYPVPIYNENDCLVNYECSGATPSCLAFPDLVECTQGYYPVPTYDDNGCLNGYVCTSGDPYVCQSFPDLVECAQGSYPVPVYDDNNCLVNYECDTSGNSEVIDCNRQLWDCMQLANHKFSECLSNTQGEDCSGIYEEAGEACYSNYNSCTGASTSVAKVNFSSIIRLIKNTPTLRFLKNTAFDFNIKKADGSVETIGIKLGEERIEVLRVGGLEESSIVINVQEGTINKILSSEKPTEEAVKSLKTKDINLEGKSFWTKLKLFFLRIALLFA